MTGKENPKIYEKYLLLSTTNPTCIKPGLNMDLCHEKLATDCPVKHSLKWISFYFSILCSSQGLNFSTVSDQDFAFTYILFTL
jgi:hypothetical protein